MVFILPKAFQHEDEGCGRTSVRQKTGVKKRQSHSLEMENEVPFGSTLQGCYHTLFPKHPCKKPLLWFQGFLLLGGCEMLGAILRKGDFFLLTHPSKTKSLTSSSRLL